MLGRLFDVEQLPDRAFLGVVGAGRIAGRGPNAAILFGDQVFLGEVLGRAISPVAAGALVQELGERLGQPIGERLDHDGVVIVVLCLEASRPAPRCPRPW